MTVGLAASEAALAAAELITHAIDVGVADPALVPALASEAREDYALAAADKDQADVVAIGRTQLELGALRPDTALACIDAALPTAGADARPILLALREEALLASHALPWEGPSALASYQVRALSHARRPPPLTARRRLGVPPRSGGQRLDPRRPGAGAGRRRHAKGAQWRPLTARRSPRSGCDDDPEVARAGGRLLARRGDLPVRIGRRLVVGSRRDLRTSRADVRRALRRVLSRARTASRAISCRRTSSRCTVCSARKRRSRRWTAPAGRRCASRSARSAPRSTRARRRRACWPGSSACTSTARPAPTCSRRSPPTISTLPELLHGRPSFQLLTTIAERVAPDAPFLDLFWHYRAIFAPVLRLLAAPTVRARCYHAVATGYAGLLAALWSHRTGRPLMVTEHGIYARERDMELARADWIRDDAGGVSEPRSTWAPRVSPLRRLWSSFFRALSRIAYVQARNIITLSDANRVQADRRRRAARQD